MELHPLELKVLKTLASTGVTTTKKLAEAAGIDEVAATRTSYWLSTKGLAKLEQSVAENYKITKNGMDGVENGLPEKQVVSLLASGVRTADELKERLGPIANIAIGELKKHGFVELEKAAGRLIVNLTPDGGKFGHEKTSIEDDLEKLYNGEQPAEELAAAADLLRRGLVEKVTRATRTVEITTEGKSLLGEPVKTLHNELTPEMLRSGEWQKGLRKYDVDTEVADFYPGRLHPLYLIMKKVKDIFVRLGFTEARGPFVESSFWCFDALFQPQDHPAREMADTFYMKNPKVAKLPEDLLVDKVRNAHERGVLGSTGWQYEWDAAVAAQPVLRTHTTAVSARQLAQLKPPAKIFSVGKAFRNETLDFKHLMELYQVEGIVYDERATFRDLLGYIKKFYSMMGFEKVRFRPAYFPYTEMSMEPEVWVPWKNEWMEMGGAGMFRPEVVQPLTGTDIPVLAWGLGFDRLAMLIYDLKDIRVPYNNDLKWLRGVSYDY